MKSPKSTKKVRTLTSASPRQVGIDPKKLLAAWIGVETACEGGAFAGAVGWLRKTGKLCSTTVVGMLLCIRRKMQ